MYPTPQLPSRRGSALITSMVVIIMLAAAATVLTETTVSQFHMQTLREGEVNILTASESAFNQAYDWCTQNSEAIRTLPVMNPTDDVATGSAGDLTARVLDSTISYPGVTFNVVIRKLAEGNVNQWGDEIFLLTSTATFGDTGSLANVYNRRRVEGLIRPQPNNIVKQALFSQLPFDFQGAAKTDSWTSNGSTVYQSSTPDPSGLGHGDLVSNGAMPAPQKPTNVNGKVISFADMPMPQPITTCPAGATELGAYAGGSTINAGTYHASSLNLSGGSPMIVSGAVALYVDGFISLDGNCLQFKTFSDSIIIYQNDYTTGISQLTGNDTVGTIYNTNIPGYKGTPMPCVPAQLSIVTNYSGQIKLAGNGAYSGILYAPNASVFVRGTADFYGSVMCKVFSSDPTASDGKVNGTFFFHYDDSLQNYSLPVPPAMPIAGWRAWQPLVGQK